MVRLFYEGTRASTYKLAKFLGIDYLDVKKKLTEIGYKLPIKEPRWMPWELEYLKNNYGKLPDKEISDHLNRSVDALHIISVRKLKRCRHDNIITARQLAPILGVKDPKTITRWVELNWLFGYRSDIHCGKNLMWSFENDDIEIFVHDHPWMFNKETMPESRFREIIDQEYAKDRWYSLQDACKMVGVNYISSAMASYIKKGWLHPIKKPIEGGNHWTWVFFKSDLDSFLADDPRLKDPIKKTRKRQLRRLNEGRPIQQYVVWMMKCPICRETVKIDAEFHIKGYEIEKLFQETYCFLDTCKHNYQCHVERPHLRYKIRKSSGKIKTYPANWPGKKETNGNHD